VSWPGLWEALYTSASDAFVQVGVFVGAVLLLFQYLNYRNKGALVGWIERAKGFQPLVGALLGLTPGCGGAIFVMTLYLRGSVTFGTVVATLCATMGDAAFVMIAAAPLHFVWVSLASLVVGVIVGYAVDALGLARRLRLAKVRPDAARAGGGGAPAASDTDAHLKQRHGQRDRGASDPVVHDSAQLHHLGHREGDAVDIALHHRRREPDERSLGYRLTHQGFLVYWAVLAVGLVLGVANLFGRDLGQMAGFPLLAVVIGGLGTIYGIVFTAAAHHFGAHTSHEDEEHKLYSLRETLIHGAMDTAFVTSWVFVSYLVYSLGVLALGGGDIAAGEQIIAGLLGRTGIATVVVGAALGLIPGCGPQILFISLYARGLLPFAALLANAISQDGDALFPLLVMDRRSALWATLVTSIPALVFGLLMYLLETSTALGALLRP
jgi:hypothetical protein